MIAVALHNGTTVPDKKGEDRFFCVIAQNHAEQKASKAAYRSHTNIFRCTIEPSNVEGHSKKTIKIR